MRLFNKAHARGSSATPPPRGSTPHRALMHVTNPATVAAASLGAAVAASGRRVASLPRASPRALASSCPRRRFFPTPRRGASRVARAPAPAPAVRVPLGEPPSRVPADDASPRADFPRASRVRPPARRRARTAPRRVVASDAVPTGGENCHTAAAADAPDDAGASSDDSISTPAPRAVETISPPLGTKNASSPARAGGPPLSRTTRNLALEMVRVTESAAVAAARWLGKGDKLAADAAAVRAMREHLSRVDFAGRVVIGEGEKDRAPMLANGESVGTGAPPSADVAVDPLDGTSSVAGGRDGAVSVIAVAEPGAMFDPGPAFYMDKLVVGPRAVGVADIADSPTVNVHNIAKALGKSVADVTCVVLDRERHAGLIEELRLAGARIKLIADGDVEAAVAAASGEDGVDCLFGVGGTPEGVVAAAAIRCLGGEIQGMLWPRDAADAAAIRAAGLDVTRILKTEDLCGGDAVLFAATGVSDGALLRGVRFSDFGATSHSIVTRAPSGTIREMKTKHRWDRGTDAGTAPGPR